MFYEIKCNFEGSIFWGYDVAPKSNRFRRFADTTLPRKVGIRVPIDIVLSKEENSQLYRYANL